MFIVILGITTILAQNFTHSLIYGNINDVGYYFTDIFIGSDKKKETVIIDTGSHITAFPCQQCTDCGNHMDSYFNFKRSNTSHIMNCNELDHCSLCKDSQCNYKQSYQEGSLIQGVFIRDQVVLGDNFDYPVFQVFGCHSKETNLFKTQLADGIMGLAPNQNTKLIVENMFDQGFIQNNVFSICLGKDNGIFTAGGFNQTLHNSQMFYIVSYCQEMYAVNLKDIKVGNSIAQLSKNMFGHKYETGTILDSGTTFTYLTSSIYNIVWQAILKHCKQKSNCRGQQVSQYNQRQYCYKYERNKFQNIKSFYITFPIIELLIDEVWIKFTPDNYLYSTYDKPEEMCIGIFENQDRLNVLGANFMVGKDIVFDMSNKQIGIAYSDCDPYQLGRWTKIPHVIDHQESDYFLFKLIISFAVLLTLVGIITYCIINKVVKQHTFTRLSNQEEVESNVQLLFKMSIRQLEEGIYIPPFKLAQLKSQLKQQEQQDPQKESWDLLRKSINGIINKVSISNLPNIIYELLNENLIRGKGLLVKSIMKAQMAAPNFTHIYAALIAVINTKLPEIGSLLLNRVIIQFQRAFKRNNKLLCIATTKMIAHLVNHQVAHELLALQIASILLQNPTEDSVEIACDFMMQCGQVLTDICPAGVNAIFERFRAILQEGEISRRVQYTIENLMKVRKNKFKDFPGILQELDLVEDQDKITHEIALDSKLDGLEKMNFYQFDEDFAKNEKQWAEIRKEILGEDEYLGEQQADSSEDEQEDMPDPILDMTNRDLINLRKNIYLIIFSSVDFEECANKLLKLQLRPGQEIQIPNMIILCCIKERTYLRYYGLLAQHFCLLNEIYKEYFQEQFRDYFLTIHRLEMSSLRNIAKLFAHLIFTDSIDWTTLSCIRFIEEKTTSASRIFIKVLFQEISQNIGLLNFKERLFDKEINAQLQGLFPTDSIENVTFAINMWISLGLGLMTDELNQTYEKMKQEIEQQEDTSSSDSSDESDDEMRRNMNAAENLLQTLYDEEEQENPRKKRRRSRSRSRIARKRNDR